LDAAKVLKLRLGLLSRVTAREADCIGEADFTDEADNRAHRRCSAHIDERLVRLFSSSASRDS
jgi:hypothetical protein